MSVESRSITLSSRDINPSINVNDYALDAVTTTNGTIGRQFQFMTWNNINLENMIGATYYNAYSKFTIRLLHCAVCDLCGNSTYGFSSSALTRIEYANTEFVLNGLTFDPQPYSHTNPSNTGASIIVGALTNQIPSSATGANPFNSLSTGNNRNVAYRFNKPTGNLTLTIDRIIPNTNTYAPTTAFGYGHFKFVFEIRGVV